MATLDEMLAGGITPDVNPNVVYYNDFSDSLDWKITTNPSGLATLAKTTTPIEFVSGTGAAKFTTAGTNGDYFEAHIWLPRPRSRRFVFGGRFAMMDENPANFFWYAGPRDSTNWWTGKLGHQNATNEWQTDTGGITGPVNATFLTRDMQNNATQPRWTDFAMVIDQASMTYGEVMVDEVIYKHPTSQVLRTIVNADVPDKIDLALEVYNKGTGAAAGVILVDHLFVIRDLDD